MRKRRTSSAPGMGTSISEAVLLLRARLAEIFNNNFVDAFVFLDVNGGGEISGHELRRGLYRLSLHEIWRCSIEGSRCCRYDCGYRPPEPTPTLRNAPNLHSYLLMDEKMCTEILKRMDTQGSSGGSSGIDLEEFLAVFDPPKSAQQGLKHRDVQGEIAERYSAAMKKRAQIVKTGCDWGVLEDWRRHARAKAFVGKRDVYAALSQLDALKLARTQAFDALKILQGQGPGYISAHKDERDALISTLQSSMASFRKNQDNVYNALNEGCVLMVLQTPLQDYYHIHVPTLEPGATNIQAVLEACLSALESLSEEQRKELLIKDYTPRGVKVRLPMEEPEYHWANDQWATKYLDQHPVPEGGAVLEPDRQQRETQKHVAPAQPAHAQQAAERPPGPEALETTPSQHVSAAPTQQLPPPRPSPLPPTSSPPSAFSLGQDQTLQQDMTHARGMRVWALFACVRGEVWDQSCSLQSDHTGREREKQMCNRGSRESTRCLWVFF